jgi:hypothetical protein
VRDVYIQSMIALAVGVLLNHAAVALCWRRRGADGGTIADALSVRLCYLTGMFLGTAWTICIDWARKYPSSIENPVVILLCGPVGGAAIGLFFGMWLRRRRHEGSAPSPRGDDPYLSRLLHTTLATRQRLRQF